MSSVPAQVRRVRHGMPAQASLYAMSSVVSQVLLAVLYLVAARRLGPSHFGTAVAGIAISAFLSGLVDFGLSTYWIRELSAGRMSVRKFQSEALGKVVIGSSVGLVAGAVLMLAGSDFWIAGPLTCVVAIAQVAVVPLRAHQMPLRSFVVGIVDKGMSLLVYFALGSLGVYGLGLTLAAGGVTGAAFAYFLMPAAYRHQWHGVRPSNAWRSSKNFGLFGLGVSAQALDVTLLERLSGSEAAGIYGAVTRWTAPMMLAASAVATAFVPIASAAPTARAAWSRLRASLWIIGLAVGGCGVVAMIAPWLVGLVLGSRYESSVAVLRILAVTAAFATVNQVLVVLLQARGRDGFVAKAVLSSVALQAVALMALASALGALGASISSAIAQATLCTACVIGCRHLLRSEKNVGSLPLSSHPVSKEAS